MLKQDDICGYWFLKSWDIHYEDGSVKSYEGEAVSGFLHYDYNGRMIVSLFRKESGSLISTYTGPYDIQGDTVYHYPDEGFCLAGLDQEKKRYLSRWGNRLIMKTPTLNLTSGKACYRLTWQKL